MASDREGLWQAVKDSKYTIWLRAAGLIPLFDACDEISVYKQMGGMNRSAVMRAS